MLIMGWITYYTCNMIVDDGNVGWGVWSRYSSWRDE
jgi:hypothetical protein